MRDEIHADPEQQVSYEPCDEIDLILTCVKGSVHTDNRGTLENILRKELNWEYLYRQAERHGLIPLLYYTLKNTAPDLVPEHILSSMSEIYLASMTRAMIQARQLLWVIQLGKDHGIPIIPYKGVVLSQMIYGDIGLRISFDIDIIVRQHDAIQARALLASQGYSPQTSLTPEQDKKYIQLRCEYGLSHPNQTMIDLHWQFIPWYYLEPFTESEIWSGSKVRSFEGKDVVTLSTEMMIIALCIHGAKHQWKKLRQISDIAGIIDSDKDINWDLVINLAREKRIERIVFLGLRLAEVFMKIGLPPGLSGTIRDDPDVRDLVSSCIDAMFIEEPDYREDIREVRYWLSVRESVRDKIRVIFLLVFIPNHDDWRYIPLPGILSPLYYIIRPVRLAFEYGAKR